MSVRAYRMTKITTIKDLQDRGNIHFNEDGCECFILLAGGLVKSSKQIWYYPEEDRYDVHNDIDETDDEGMSLMDMTKKTNIIEALKKAALYAY